MLHVVPHQKFHYSPEKKLQSGGTFYLDITLIYKHSLLLHVNNIYQEYQETGEKVPAAAVVCCFQSSLSFVNYLNLQLRLMYASAVCWDQVLDWYCQWPCGFALSGTVVIHRNWVITYKCLSDPRLLFGVTIIFLCQKRHVRSGTVSSMAFP